MSPIFGMFSPAYVAAPLAHALPEALIPQLLPMVDQHVHLINSGCLMESDKRMKMFVMR
jgi:hypothetical protein